MAIFKLPAVRLKKIGGAVHSPTQPAVSQTFPIGTNQHSVNQNKHSTIGLNFESTPIGDLSQKDAMVHCARETISMCINQNIIGESAGRDIYKNYSSHINTLKEGEPMCDIVYHNWRKTEKDLFAVSYQLNIGLDNPLPIFDFPFEKTSILDTSVYKNKEVLDFCVKYNVPVLSGAGGDFVVIGLVNPILQKYIHESIKSAFGGNAPFCFFSICDLKTYDSGIDFMKEKLKIAL